MTPAEIVKRLLVTGFVFSVSEDADVSYRPPPTDTPEAEALLSLLAWTWADLVPHVAEYLTTQKEKS
jgi:hypothetical protein